MSISGAVQREPRVVHRPVAAREGAAVDAADVVCADRVCVGHAPKVPHPAHGLISHAPPLRARHLRRQLLAASHARGDTARVSTYRQLCHTINISR